MWKQTKCRSNKCWHGVLIGSEMELGLNMIYHSNFYKYQDGTFFGIGMKRWMDCPMKDWSILFRGHLNWTEGMSKGLEILMSVATKHSLTNTHKHSGIRQQFPGMAGKVALLKDHGELCLLGPGRGDSWFNPRSSWEGKLGRVEGVGRPRSKCCVQGGLSREKSLVSSKWKSPWKTHPIRIFFFTFFPPYILVNLQCSAGWSS